MSEREMDEVARLDAEFWAHHDGGREGPEVDPRPCVAVVDADGCYTVQLLCGDRGTRLGCYRYDEHPDVDGPWARDLADQLATEVYETLAPLGAELRLGRELD